MSKNLIKALWGALVGMACVLGTAGRAEAAVTIDPAANTAVTYIKGVIFVAYEAGNPSNQNNPAELKVFVSNEPDPVTIHFNIYWTQTPAAGDAAVSFNEPVISDGSGIAIYTAATSPDYNPVTQSWYRKYELTVTSDTPNVEVTIGMPVPLFANTSYNANIYASLPEPATIVLLGSGLAGLAAARRRQKMRKAA